MQEKNTKKVQCWMSVLFNMKNKETLLSRIDIKVDIKCQC